MARLAIYYSCATLFALVAISPSRAAAADVNKFATRLLPSPVSDLTAASVTGSGHVSATLDQNKLAVSGDFVGLSSPATEAHLFIGPGIGIPGKSVLDLTVSQGTDGMISGQFNLTREQTTALKEGHIYLQIDAQKSSTPYGTLWGWLLPAHEIVKQDVPEEGHWFLPQYDIPQGK